MKIAYFGDTFGSPGRQAVESAIRRLKSGKEIDPPDVMIVNGENMCHGRGILPKMAHEFFALGVDVLTTGNHVWDQKETAPFIATEPRLLRPINYLGYGKFQVPGQGFIQLPPQGRRTQPLVVAQWSGRVHMEAAECPFRSADQWVEKWKDQGLRCVFVDFHAEATSEKQAFAHFLDGRVSAVIGSHTHVQTADERILPGGTAAITDAGLCGAHDGVIGVKKENAIRRFLTKMPTPFDPSEGPGRASFVIVEIDEATGRSKSIERFQWDISG